MRTERVRRQQQVSSERWHNELLVSTGGEIDDELLTWVEHAFALTDPRADG